MDAADEPHRWTDEFDKYSDIQVPLTEGASPVIQTAAEATIYGLESDLQASLTEHWTVHGSRGYNHHEYNHWHDSRDDDTWRKLQNAPEWTANIASAYGQRVASGAGMRFTVNAAFQSWMYLDGANSAVLRAPARTLAGAGTLLPAGRRQVGRRRRGQEPHR